jgi:hypothetical protein
MHHRWQVYLLPNDRPQPGQSRAAQKAICTARRLSRLAPVILRHLHSLKSFFQAILALQELFRSDRQAHCGRDSTPFHF